MKTQLSILTKSISLVLILFNFKILNAQQNLVINGGFENYTICPSATNNIPPNNWYITSNVNYAVYANACSNSSCCSLPYNYWGGYSSYQPSHNGNGYIGLTFFYQPNEWTRNYMQSKLISSLQQDKKYNVTFYVSLANTVKYASNNVSLLFTANPIYQDTVNDPTGIILANAQVYNYGNPIITDTMNWVKVSAIYKAQGGEQYITLGNFKSNAQTNTIVKIGNLQSPEAAYYIDDVSVTPLDSMCLQADAGRDTTITAGDSVFIGSYTNGIDSLRWVTGLTVIDSIRPGFWVHPTNTTKYILCQQVNGCATCDTVTVTVQPLPLKITNYELRMINDKQVLNKWTTATEINVSHYNILRSINGNDFTIVGKVKANNKAINEYQFTDNRQQSTVDSKLYYRIVGVDNDGKLTYSEVRAVDRQHTTNNSILIFPNPAKDIVNIECKEGINELRLIDIYGKEVVKYTYNNINHLSLNIHHYTKGIYILNIVKQNGSRVNEKVILE